MSRLGRIVVTACVLFLGALAQPAAAQVASTPIGQPPTLVLPAPLPATRLEGFPEINSVVTLGYDFLGAIGGGKVLLDVREVRDTKGNKAGGATVRVLESQSRQERAFVDVDEIPDLLRVWTRCWH